MAEFVNRRTTRQIALFGTLFCVPFAHAENLVDPTRPPAALEQGSTAGGVTSSGPVLQSVLIAPGRTLAMISGQTVKVGDRVGEARVVKISETEVVLRNGKDLETLKLFPGIEKRRSAGPGNLGRQK
ncbi:MAG: hypothetical protein JWM42_4183 [Burkholderia sp.]|jgi:MSHA biogenesis protein MshK|nr:hypothetical protein [Burkholderia sp.]